MALKKLIGLDGLKESSLGSKKCYIHKDHRWVLPILYHEQEINQLPRPCNIITFDYHHDALEPICMDEISKLQQNGFSIDELIALCEDELGKSDDDWIRA